MLRDRLGVSERRACRYVGHDPLERRVLTLKLLQPLGTR